MNKKLVPGLPQTAAATMYRSLTLILYVMYALVVTYWFSSVVGVTNLSSVLLCFLLALGSLKVSVNWTVLGVFVVFVARYDWQAPRIDLVPGLWLGYLGLLVCGFRAYYSDFHNRLRRIAHCVRTSKLVDGRKQLFLLVLRVLLGLSSAMLVLVAGVILLMYSPYGDRREAWLDSSLARKEVMWPGATALVLLLAGFIVLREWSWRQKNAGQAAVFLRSDRLNWQYRDLIRVVKIQNRDNGKE
ncbi:hypothetical protein SH449x_000353 [Pirellulaceae bacterium SH449]